MVDFLLHTERFELVEQPITAAHADLHVPSLCDVEYAAALRRILLLGTLSESRAEEALVDYDDLPLTRHGHQGLLRRIFDLRSNFTAYDGAYVALAERLEAPLLTTDERLARAAREHLGLSTLPS